METKPARKAEKKSDDKNKPSPDLFCMSVAMREFKELANREIQLWVFWLDYLKACGQLTILWK
jgi:hypothetical protein